MTQWQGGYPPEYLRHWRARWRGAALVILLSAVIAAWFGYRAIFGNGEIQFAGVAVAALFFLLWAQYASLTSRVRIALYFEAKVPGDAVWSEVLARHCTHLDKLAEATGHMPLSAFGFADDFHGENVVWHDPGQGMDTVSVLIQQLRDDQQRIEEASAALADLEKMRDRLRTACGGGTRFCFIFHLDGINGMEIEQRSGCF